MGKIEDAPRFEIPFDYSLARLKKEFVKTGTAQGWMHADFPLVLAVSGGSDSMAMLWLFSLFRNRKLVVAHLNHGIRGKESMEDARFVTSMADRFEIRCIQESLSVPDLLEKGESLEDGARRIRYDFLEKTRAAVGGWGIGVAHTSDDSVETFLHNLFRGSGVRGLSGIPEKRERIFRPLLNFSRVFLREALTYHGIPWREDSTNEDTAYMRNRIRNILIPVIEKEINDSARKHILGTARDLAFFRNKEEKLQESLLLLASVSLPHCSYACRLSFLRHLDKETAAIFLRGAGRALKLKSLSRERTENLLRLIQTDGQWCFQWQSRMHVFSSFPFVTWVDPVILNNQNPSGMTVSLEDDHGTFTWNNWFFSWRRELTETFSAGWMQAIFPFQGKIVVSSVSDLQENHNIWAPQWGRDIFPVVRSGSFEWIPFWGIRKTAGTNGIKKEAVRILSKYSKSAAEKGKENGL
jgi:tRNA(Ile)-lysidine synthase